MPSPAVQQRRTMKASLQSGPDSRTMRGGTIPGTRQPAFALVTPKAPALPVILAAPHGGRTYPEALWAAMRHPVSSALALEDRLVDRLARESGARTGAAVLTAQAPRAMIDLNRAADEIDWTMVAEGAPGGAGADKENGVGANRAGASRRVRGGLGLVPRRVAGHGEIWRHPLAGAALDARIGQVHAPYHAALGQALAGYRDLFGAVLLLDIHSMPPLKAATTGQAAADYVIGDRFGAAASDRLSAIALRVLSPQARPGQEGLAQAGPCAHNRPYAGGYVLERHADPAGGIHAMQLEISRDLYLDSAYNDAGAGWGGVVDAIVALTRALGEETQRIGDERTLPVAAE